MKELEHKRFPFNVSETKTIERDGLKLGVIKGFLATYGNVDRVNDRIEQGAFASSLKRIERQRPSLPMFFQHDRGEPIGGFPVTQINDVEKGLDVVGEVNLLQGHKGEWIFSLAKQGVLSFMSIGFSIKEGGQFTDDDGVRVLTDLELWEGSIVDEPANTQAMITEVKKFTVDETQHITNTRTLEKALRESGAFSKEAATAIAGRFVLKQGEPVEEEKQVDMPLIKTMTSNQFKRIESIINNL